MNINFTLGASITSAPAGTLPAGLTEVLNYVENQVENWYPSVTSMPTIVLNYGIPAGSGGPSTALALTFASSRLVSYSALRAALVSANASDNGLLPETDPTSGKGVAITYAEAKVLGITLPPNGTQPDATIDLSSTYPLDFNLSDDIGGTVPAGEYDAVTILEHELSEAFGRMSGVAFGYTSSFDLFSTTISGARDFVTPYGTAPFNQTPGLDLGDLALSTNDAFNAVEQTGPAIFSQIDAYAVSLLGGTDISLTVSCFTPGTRIGTPRGEQLVELLNPGDQVLVHEEDGTRFKPIIWVGKRTIDLRRHPEPYKVLPVLIRAGAFADMSPEQDLLLSPDHAVYADGFLIPIKLLTNGKTITQLSKDRVMDGKVTYLHIELENHSIIYANGLPTESFLDTGDRNHFTNGGQVIKLHPIFGQSGDAAAQIREARIAAPLRLIGKEVDRVRQRTEERAIPILAQRSPTPLVLQLTL